MKKFYAFLANNIDILQALLVTFILFNFMMLYAAAAYSDEYYPLNLSDKIWYSVEGGIYPFVSVLLINYNVRKIYFKITWWILAGFFLIRWLCEIVVFTFSMNANAPKPMIAFLFYLSFTAIVIIATLPYLIRFWHFLIRLWNFLIRVWKILITLWKSR